MVKTRYKFMIIAIAVIVAALFISVSFMGAFIPQASGNTTVSPYSPNYIKNMDDSSITKSTPQNYIFTNVTVSGSNMTHVLVNRAYLNQDVINSALITNASVNGSSLSDITLMHVLVNNSYISHATVENGTVQNSIVSSTYLQDIGISNSSIMDSTIMHTTIEHAIITDATIRDAFINNTVLIDVSINSTVSFGTNFTILSYPTVTTPTVPSPVTPPVAPTPPTVPTPQTPPNHPINKGNVFVQPGTNPVYLLGGNINGVVHSKPLGKSFIAPSISYN